MQVKKGNNSNKMLDRVVFSCQQNGVNTFYKEAINQDRQYNDQKVG